MEEMTEVIRKITAPLRVLPDFLVIGVVKGGTTSLFSNLAAHPCFFGQSKKEIHFFNKPENFCKGNLWYRSNFPTMFKKYHRQHVLKKIFITGEATPVYLIHPLVPQRVSKVLPHVKLIVMLRNPIDRAFSHYHHEVGNGREHLSFEEAIKDEERRLEMEIDMDRRFQDEDYDSYSRRPRPYLARGIYWKQLQNWFLFYPREQFLIIKSEDYFNDPATVFQEVNKFLGLPNYELAVFKNQNKGSYLSTKSEKTRNYLADYYKPHNQKLYQLLNRDFGWQ